MSEKGTQMDGSQTAASARKDAWIWHPPLPLQGIPVFVWPPWPLAALKYLLSLGFLGSVMLPFGALAIVVAVVAIGLGILPAIFLRERMQAIATAEMERSQGLKQ